MNELLTGVVIAALISGAVTVVGWLIKRPLDRAAVEQTTTATAVSLIAPLRAELDEYRDEILPLRRLVKAVRDHIPNCDNPQELQKALDNTT